MKKGVDHNEITLYHNETKKTIVFTSVIKEFETSISMVKIDYSVLKSKHARKEKLGVVDVFELDITGKESKEEQMNF